MQDELDEIIQLRERTLVLRGKHLAALQADDRILAVLAERAAAVQQKRRRRRRHLRSLTVVPIAAGCAGVAEFAKAQPAAAAAVVAAGTVVAAIGLGWIEQPGITHRPPPIAGQRPAVVSPGTPPPPSGRRPTRLEPVAFKQPITAATGSRRRPPARVSVGGTTVRVTPHAPAVGTPRLPRPLPPPHEQPVEVPPVESPGAASACVADVRLVTRVRLLCPDE